MMGAPAAARSGWTGPVALVLTATRRVVFFNFGIPWIITIILIGIAAMRAAPASAANADSARAGFMITAGFFVTSIVTLFSPIALFGRPATGSRPGWISSLPFSPVARAVAPALAGAAAGFLLILLFFLALLPLGGPEKLDISQKLQIASTPADHLKLKGESVAFSFDAPAGSWAEISPRIGYAWGYGDPTPVTLAWKAVCGEVTKELKFTIRSRQTRRIELHGNGVHNITITRLDDGPVVFWPEGSVFVTSAVLGWSGWILQFSAPFLLYLLFLASAGSACAAALARPYAMGLAFSIFFASLFAPAEWMRGITGIAGLLDSTGWWSGVVATPSPIIYIRVIICCILLLGAATFARSKYH